MTTLQAARNLLESHYNRDGRWQAVGVLTILPGAGMLNPGEPNDHQTWWPSKDFDPLEECRNVT